ncbi:putative metallo-beta-lactamase domain protein [Aspergillus fischeri NRRL 181]|uniref:Metallo-beta-lactamase domain protein, putative n=1 Tax=Neosartorya fischeri (strain ATCC 1020 / DSM 3700 / CBS 544.65 / FGSC A1164 / JCM 1740 / NRRL 181 / WB 181) TaxID=331117 RepID=A1DP16_NEOFI|nr:metallo-beta-lactamase domain protein, putative [Aspergillus fischeri NRRL 181]EAW16537.1 metallo-beta-lactamase domain protein, putative [Aspergillus fischeri NRRL 181]
MATQLVPLSEVERLSASVVRILGGNPGKFTLQGTNTYLIGRGHQRILIDTGEGKPSWANHLKGVLAKENATVHKALLTHWHHDHVNGVPDLLEICPQATVYKHQPDEGQLDIEDGQVFSVEGATLKAYHTPGHTVDHMMFVLEEEDAIITGDNVLGHGTAVFEDLPVYLSSLQRMQNRVSGRGYPGHGAVIENATTKITEYINHRQQREEEVIRVLRYGKLDVPDNEPSPERKASWTPIELVKVIYRNVPESLHLPASHGVLQVLMKLEAEGKVVHDTETGKWRIDIGKSAL